MIFITVGTQRFQFNRLLIEIDKLIEENKINEEVFAQIGYSTYRPKNYKFKEFINKEEYEEALKNSDIVITHGGTGTIIKAIKLRKRIIAIPRLKDFKEHVDNHQIEIISEFSEIGFLKKIKDLKDLCFEIEAIKNFEIKDYISNTNNIISEIEKYIEGEV
ncbi:PssE/Cps14G family polysaccharide biosynthesis glycosyltransferase [Clostridium sp. AL.422]|uniref:PssE/Cps14G family polysaccharide biosynthesis glycosyltransferase n=1 Tax=Clostridium TaxID=1485 RepID=UPI00293DBE65|nr:MULTISPECIES: PssE/Cps14G family polysaccharide biosynthesis glycosyltransferase [unclassified Clostridium]MDV4150426.1 PssE/Cps14G family polysaccharide biosynthesis glycosyltransferase [Clostridium sp. AL.422]